MKHAVQEGRTASPPDDPDGLRDEIAAARAYLGDTIEALAAKTDVKARTKDAVGDFADQAKAAAPAASTAHPTAAAGDRRAPRH